MVSITLHVLTFFTIVSASFLLAVFPFLIVGIVCSNALWPRRGFSFPGKSGLIMAVLLAYFIFHFVYMYRTTGGAAGVGIENGQHVYTYKTRVIRAITDEEYKMWPNLITRVMSVWMAIMAIGLATQFKRSPDGPAQKS